MDKPLNDIGPEELAAAQEAVFYGSFEHNLDEKGRVSLPAQFRQSLRPEDESSVVVTNFITDGVRCLDGFSLSGWKRFEASLRKHGRFDPAVRKLENFYFARASLCVVDGSGRINIPVHLREYAGFERQVVFTSSLYGFRLWRKEVWDLVFQEAESLLLENPGLFNGVDK